MKTKRKEGSSVVTGVVRTCAGPFTGDGLDEALGLTVGLGAIGSGEAVGRVAGRRRRRAWGRSVGWRFTRSATGQKIRLRRQAPARKDRAVNSQHWWHCQDGLEPGAHSEPRAVVATKRRTFQPDDSCRESSGFCFPHASHSRRNIRRPSIRGRNLGNRDREFCIDR
jgi:hypothetical protein